MFYVQIRFFWYISDYTGMGAIGGKKLSYVLDVPYQPCVDKVRISLQFCTVVIKIIASGILSCKKLLKCFKIP